MRYRQSWQFACLLVLGGLLAACGGPSLGTRLAQRSANSGRSAAAAEPSASATAHAALPAAELVKYLIPRPAGSSTPPTRWAHTRTPSADLFATALLPPAMQGQVETALTSQGAHIANRVWQIGASDFTMDVLFSLATHAGAQHLDSLIEPIFALAMDPLDVPVSPGFATNAYVSPRADADGTYSASAFAVDGALVMVVLEVNSVAINRSRFAGVVSRQATKLATAPQH